MIQTFQTALSCTFVALTCMLPGLPCQAQAEPDLTGIVGIDEYTIGVGGTTPAGPAITYTHPWIHIAYYGWMYLDPNAAREGYWVWTEQLGWMYSSEDRYPESYLLGVNEWVLLDTTVRNKVRYWSYSAREWVYLYKPGYSKYSEFDKVPAELVGINYTQTSTHFHKRK